MKFDLGIKDFSNKIAEFFDSNLKIIQNTFKLNLLFMGIIVISLIIIIFLLLKIISILKDLQKK